ncbi:AraC family transcriptional regulator [Shewanella algidipiscicola]|uniref:Transcriptional regulator n=1 Tax=Shewanella algidipiscicola TaxID=614070 RepID=A0ABQ4PAF1_9GAMM|nr:helix-turn-helix transcriptional regulator [Shewanella algidipiscicola]GIU44547.1 transcriptional regulator [Shewanella algidipiscicola]
MFKNGQIMLADPFRFPDFDSDIYPQQVVSLRLMGGDRETETPLHQHYKSQLVMPLSGFVKCNIADAIWMVPPHCAVWIPSQVRHSNLVSKEANVCMLFIDPEVAGLPTKICTLSISPLLRELIVHLTSQEQTYQAGSTTDNLVNVLLDQLRVMPTEQFNFPIPSEPRLKAIAMCLLSQPAERQTVREWASQFAMSERTLSRLVKQHVGLSFGRWRGQLHLVLALQWLTCGESVQRIAEDLGYESVGAFINFFKHALGQPPKQYMKQRDY